jgi:hypothetical protein
MMDDPLDDASLTFSVDRIHTDEIELRVKRDGRGAWR